MRAEDHRSDADLIAAAGAGDRAAFAVIVARYQRPVFQLARALVRDAAEAEDVLQDTFLAALRGASRFRGDAPFASWLFAIARHAAYRRGRRAGEVSVEEASLEQLGAAAGWGQDDVEAALLQAERHAQLSAALTRLPDEEREVVMLRDGLGLSGEEAAASLGVSIAAMKSRLHRARLRLAGMLRAQGGAHGAR